MHVGGLEEMLNVDERESHDFESHEMIEIEALVQLQRRGQLASRPFEDEDWLPWYNDQNILDHVRPTHEA